MHGEGEIGKVYVTEFSASHIVDHATMRRNVDKVCRRPSAGRNLSRRCAADGEAVEGGRLEGDRGRVRRSVLWMEKLNLIGKSHPENPAPGRRRARQDRGPLHGERSANHHVIPMVTMVRWQIASCRRISESCRIKWEDLDYEKRCTWSATSRTRSSRSRQPHVVPGARRCVANPDFAADGGRAGIPVLSKSVSANFT
jgi:integrase